MCSLILIRRTIDAIEVVHGRPTLTNTIFCIYNTDFQGESLYLKFLRVPCTSNQHPHRQPTVHILYTQQPEFIH